MQYTYTREHTIEYWPTYRCLAKLLEQLRMPTKSIYVVCEYYYITML